MLNRITGCLAGLAVALIVGVWVAVLIHDAHQSIGRRIASAAGRRPRPGAAQAGRPAGPDRPAAASTSLDPGSAADLQIALFYEIRALPRRLQPRTAVAKR